MRHTAALCALLCALALAQSEARAATAVAMSTEEQVASARAICIGRCTRIESRRVDGRIFTYITLDVREVLKGSVDPGTLVIKQAGGEVGEYGSWISGSPRFDVGRDSLVFLADNGEGAYVVADLFMGNYFLETGADGRTWVARDSGGDGARVLPNKDPRVVPAPDRMPLAGLRAVVARHSAKESGAPAGPVEQVPSEYHYYEGPSELHPAFVLHYNQRWFEPDSGQTVLFYLNPNNFEPGIDPPPSLEAAVVDSLEAWSTVPGSSLRLAYGGVESNGCGWWPLDAVTRISTDCRNEITGEGCRGIIAIGGGHYTTREQVVVNGVTFRKIVEADVALQNGWCDYFQNPVALREVITHEVGHCIGLGHSADTTSNMAPFIHNDGRGATLRPDDMDGVRFIYPGDGGGGEEEPEPPPPAIATVSLPLGRVGESYAAVFAVRDGKDPYVWTMTSGALPPGLALSANGLLAGEPVEAGAFVFSVRVTDALGRVDGRFFTLTMRPPLPAVLAASYSGAKKRLTIAGAHFEEPALFEINGVLVTPKKPPSFDPATSTFVVKGSRKKLKLNKGAGTNQIVVVVRGERSPPFLF